MFSCYMESYLNHQIHDILLRSRHPVFISDERIDGDSLGSSLAVADYLTRYGKKTPVFVAQSIPSQYQRMPCIEFCTSDSCVFNDPEIDLVVVFDCSDAAFVEGLVSMIPTRPTVINIDHHVTNTRYGDINQVMEEAAATAFVIHRFFEMNNVIPSKDAATCLLTGLCFDTTAFSNSSTNEQVFDAASKLILHGARVQDVIKTMFKNRSVSALRVWGVALERLQEDKNEMTITTFLTRKDIEENQVSDEEIDGLSNFLNLMLDTGMLRVMRETHDGHVKVSMRSQTRDVAAIAKANGGGGHVRAAGYLIQNARLVCKDGVCWEVEKTVGMR